MEFEGRERIEVRSGWGTRHTSPTYWAAAVTLQTDRMNSAHTDLVARMAVVDGLRPGERSDAVMAAFGRLRIETHFLLIAIRHVLRCYRRSLHRTSSRDVEAAGAAFDAHVPHAKAFRDVLEHIDEYEAGAGRLQANDSEAQKFGLRLDFDANDPNGHVTLLLGKRSVPVKDAALAAIDLADAIEAS